jgi:hypothetical protein
MKYRQLPPARMQPVLSLPFKCLQGRRLYYSEKPNASALQVFYETVPLVAVILLANWNSNKLTSRPSS